MLLSSDKRFMEYNKLRYCKNKLEAVSSCITRLQGIYTVVLKSKVFTLDNLIFSDEP